MFQPKGINVNFYYLKHNRVYIYTYEKGVETLMLSCASGSSAVIFHLANNKLITSPVTSYSLGGELEFNFDNNWKNAWVWGPAIILFQSKVSLGAMVPYDF